MISTMYKCTKDSSQFEEKTYKVPPKTSTCFIITTSTTYFICYILYIVHTTYFIYYTHTHIHTHTHTHTHHLFYILHIMHCTMGKCRECRKEQAGGSKAGKEAAEGGGGEDEAGEGETLNLNPKP
jgi:uncharacterized membrane protein (DUF485 family)